MNGADSRAANLGDVKKINNCIECTHTQWACSQSVKDYLLRGWNLPTLAASIAAIINVNDLNGADSQSANAGNVKKINNRVDSAQTQWSCSPSVPDYLSKGWNLPSLTAANSVISNVDDMNGADSQAANAVNVKKINNRIEFTHTQWACSQSVQDYLLRGWNLPCLTASIAAIINVDDMNRADSQSANAKDVKKINNCVDSTQAQ